MKPGCLSEIELRAVLAGTATEEARVSAERHLDTCTHCRDGLEALAGSAEDFRKLQTREASDATHVTPLLDQVIRDFAVAPPKNSNEATNFLEPAGILQYLAVSQHEGSLGRLGDYEVIEVVAAGGMGIVLKALDTRLNRIVAFKVLAPALAADSRARQRFLREARAVAAVHHDHVVGIYAVGEANDLPFIAMEFVEGESVAQRLKRDGRLPVEQAVRLGKEVATGLAAAHARGIIHRDIKPANVLIERATGRAKITDFGLARAVDDTGLTQSGFIAGTPEYLSPEQAADQPLDARSDLFSLGSLLYAACVGKSPFQAATTLAVLRRVADHTPLPVCQLNSDIPRWFSGVIERLLAKDPADRFASAEELIKSLDAEASGTTQKTRDHWRTRLRPALAATLVLSAIIALVLFIIRPSTSRTLPFVVRGENDKSIGEYADWGQALRNAPARATIDLRWNGERDMTPIKLPARPLMVRAADSFHPIWVHRSASEPALNSSAALKIEGIEFRYDPSSARPAQRTNAAPPRPNQRPPGPGLDVEPSGASLVRSVGGSLKVTRCLLKREGPFLQEDDGFAGITLQSATNCTVTDTAFFFGAGKGLVCRGGQPSITISNCLLFASQAVWMDAAPNAEATLRIERSSAKGGTVILFPPTPPSKLTVTAQSNLFNTVSVLVDRRTEADRFLRTWVKWEDRANLFSLDRRGGPQGRFVRFENPEVGPPRLFGWNNFWGQGNSGSVEAQAHFAKIRQPGSASAADPPTFEDFRIMRIEDGTTRAEDFGADVSSLEAALTFSALPR